MSEGCKSRSPSKRSPLTRVPLWLARSAIKACAPTTRTLAGSGEPEGSSERRLAEGDRPMVTSAEGGKKNTRDAPPSWTSRYVRAGSARGAPVSTGKVSLTGAVETTSCISLDLVRFVKYYLLGGRGETRGNAQDLSFPPSSHQMRLPCHSHDRRSRRPLGVPARGVECCPQARGGQGPDPHCRHRHRHRVRDCGSRCARGRYRDPAVRRGGSLRLLARGRGVRADLLPHSRTGSRSRSAGAGLHALARRSGG